MNKQEIDRIECAIRHIESSLDVDSWAAEIAVEAMKKQIPVKPVKSKEPRYGMGYVYHDWVCPSCGEFLAPEPAKTGSHHCRCGQVIDWEVIECQLS